MLTSCQLENAANCWNGNGLIPGENGGNPIGRAEDGVDGGAWNALRPPAIIHYSS